MARVSPFNFPGGTLKERHDNKTVHSADGQRSSIEQLFLLRRFDDALELAYEALSELTEQVDKAKIKGKRAKHLFDANTELLKLRHECESHHCECVPLVTLVIQILFEMGRAQDVTTYVSQFYGEVQKIPYDILFLCINLLVNSLSDFLEAKRMLMLVLSSKNAPETSVHSLTEDQRIWLEELLVFHVLLPLGELSEALSFVEREALLPRWKQEGWIKYIKKTMESKNSMSLGRPSEASNNTTPSSPKQQINVRTGSITNQFKTLVNKSKELTKYLLMILRRNYNSRFSVVAYGVVIVMSFWYLFATWTPQKKLESGKNGQKSFSSPPPRSNQVRTNTDVQSFWGSVSSLMTNAFNLNAT